MNAVSTIHGKSANLYVFIYQSSTVTVEFKIK